MKDDPLEYEEAYFSKDRKASRKERKRVQDRDRSKYKKTDQDKVKKKTSKGDNLKRGRIISITPEEILVMSKNKQYPCVLRGLLKKEKTSMKSLIALGDFVHFEEQETGQNTITFIEERYSFLSRSDPLSQKKEQLIAVNIDQVFIVVSFFLPSLKPTLIDRYIISAQKGNMHPIILFNKCDLIENPPSSLTPEQVQEEVTKAKQALQNYQTLDITALFISAETGEGIDELKALMKGQTSVFSGQSGVGKSTLLNRALDLNLSTGELARKTWKGSHTTTRAELLPLEEGGFCIDTPGIKSFGVWKLDQNEIRHYFAEFSEWEDKCYFPNCTHTHEPDCAVKKAAEEHLISPMRYESYISLLESDKRSM